ncbi:MAG: phosphoenolpyruvate--protein phosphotransferase [bacterium]
MIKAIAVSEGIVISKVFKIDGLNLKIKRKYISDTQKEIKRFEESVVYSSNQIEILRQTALKRFGSDKAEIFEAHLLVIQDPELYNQVKNLIIEEKVTAEYALLKVRNNFIDIFSAMEDNTYMQERAFDIKDTTNRALAYLTNQKYADLLNIKEEVIIIANDLSPSETVLLDKKYVKGIITNIGGRTSHAAIITRSLSIPCIVGANDITNKCVDNDVVVLDAIEGKIFINPSDILINEYNEKITGYNEHLEIVKQYKDKQTITKDNHKIKICANIEGTRDLSKVINYGAEGIGLFRTEFIYMENMSLPTEEEQFKIYKDVLSSTTNSVIMRTLDIGGDKNLPYLNLDEEINPALGYRAIRMCLDKKELFKTQLRALLRASIYGELKIMFPMISLVEELFEAKQLLKEVELELIKEGFEIKEYQVGMTVEVPSAAILADHFAKHIDFFSIGTNDLIQYTFAADRLNQKVSYFYQPLHPSVLRLIKYVIDCAHKENKIVAMCGEAASDINVIPILVGFGLDEFSMSPALIPASRFLISKLNKNELSKLSNQFLLCETSEEVMGLITEKFK